MKPRRALSLAIVAAAFVAAAPVSACMVSTGNLLLFAKPPAQVPDGLVLIEGKVVATPEAVAEERGEAVLLLARPTEGLQAGTRVRVQSLRPNCGDEWGVDEGTVYLIGRFSSVDPRNAIFMAMAFPAAAPRTFSKEELDRHIVDPAMAQLAERDRDSR